MRTFNNLLLTSEESYPKIRKKRLSWIRSWWRPRECSYVEQKNRDEEDFHLSDDTLFQSHHCSENLQSGRKEGIPYTNDDYPLKRIVAKPLPLLSRQNGNSHSHSSDSVIGRSLPTIKLDRADRYNQGSTASSHKASCLWSSKLQNPKVATTAIHHTMSPTIAVKHYRLLATTGSFSDSVDSLDSLAESYWDPGDETSLLHFAEISEIAKSGKFFHEHVRFLRVQTQPRQVEVIWSKGDISK